MIKDRYLLHKQRNKLQLHSLSTCSSTTCARINCSPPPTCLRRDCCFRGSKRLFLGNFAKAPRCVFFSSVYTVAMSVTLLNGPMKHFAWILHVICNWQSCRKRRKHKERRRMWLALIFVLGEFDWQNCISLKEIFLPPLCVQCYLTGR